MKKHLLFLLFLFACINHLRSQVLDHSFNTTTHGYKFYARGKALENCYFTNINLANDKIILSGNVFSSDNYYHPYLCMLNSDGTFSSSFNSTGEKTIAISSANSDYLADIQVTTNSIYLSSITNGSAQNGEVKKLDLSGTIDPTFGTSGKINLYNSARESFLISTLPNDSFYVYGKYEKDSSYISKYNSNGQIDPRYENNGLILLPNIAVHKILSLSDKSLLLFGQYNKKHTLVKLRSDLRIDSTFGINGYRTYNATANISKINAVERDKQGSFYILYDESGGSSKIIKIKSDYTLDATFGTNGILELPYYYYIRSMTIDTLPTPNQLIVGGYYYSFSALKPYTVVSRHSTSTGLTLAETTLDLSLNGFIAEVIAIQSDRRIVVAGYNNSIDFIREFGVARLNPDFNTLLMPITEPSRLQATFTLYPNPSQETLYIDSPYSSLEKITIKSMTGKVCKEFLDNPNTISIADLEAGMYLLYAESEGEKVVRKFVKE